MKTWRNYRKFSRREIFDLAMASYITEHVELDTTALTELYKVLKDGGTSVISMANRYRFVAVVVDFFKGKRKFPWYDHFMKYTHEIMEKLIQGTPFKKYEIIPVAFGLIGWNLFIYMHTVPKFPEKCCGFWVVLLRK